jgi:glucose/arabinose dehydrogenase
MNPSIRYRLRLLPAIAALSLLVAPLGAQPTHAATQFVAHKVIGSLSNAVAFTFAPNGDVFYVNRLTGEINIWHAATKTKTNFFTVPNVVGASNNEQGLLGIALDPDYPSTPSVYVYATRDISGEEHNQILRITDNGGTGQNLTTVFSASTTAGQYHDGGRILFGPDGKLYATMGEAHGSTAAQQLGNPAGKVLRMNADGSVPNDNPFAGSRIWSYGLRNSFGLGFDPESGNLWETENGPACNDEINRIVKGGNFGWGPSQTCSTPPQPPKNTNQDGPNPILPKRFYTPTIAPTGIVFCEHCSLGARQNGTLFFGAHNTDQIRELHLTDNRRGVASQAVVFTGSTGIYSMEAGPDGRLYFSDHSGIWKLTRA